MANRKNNNTNSSLNENSIPTIIKTFADVGNTVMVGVRTLLPAKKAKNIVILGMKGAGKTTLWHGLGGIETVKMNTQVEEITPFIFKRENGRRVKVVREVGESDNKKTRGKKKKIEIGGFDIGGEDSYVPRYDVLIVRDSFVYYIVDATKILEYQYRRRMRSDFRKIDSVVTDDKKKIGEDHFGFKILLSHYDEWAKNQPDPNPSVLYDSFFKEMAGIKADGPVRKHLLDRDESILMAINLIEDSEIKKIKEEISKV